MIEWIVKTLCRRRVIPDRQQKDVPYLSRNYLLGNALSPWFLAIHKIHKSDADKHLHSHPFHYIALQFGGVMYEVQPDGMHKRRAGYLRIRPRSSLHRLILPHGPVWSLFFGFARAGSWGFAIGGKIVNHAEYLK